MGVIWRLQVQLGTCGKKEVDLQRTLSKMKTNQMLAPRSPGIAP
jgi:hypothetical protein